MTLTTVPEKTTPTPVPTAVTPALAPSWRLPGLDGLRAMACMMVYMVHCWEFADAPKMPVGVGSWTIETGHLFEPFRAGVDLFMVLSGFCLFWPVCKSAEALAKWDWKDYVKRRIRRIVPPYYAAIAYALLFGQILVVGLCFITIFKQHAWASPSRIAEIFSTAHWQDPSTFWRIISHLLFIHSLFPNAWDQVTGAFWSLGLEMQFYIAFPFVLFAFRKHATRAIAWVIGISIAYRLACGLWFYLFPLPKDSPYEIIPFLLTITFLGRWMQFAVGMYTALTVARHLRQQKTRSATMGNLFVLIALVLFYLIDSVLYDPRMPKLILIFPWRDVLLAVAFGLLIFAVTSTRTWVRALFEWRPVTWIGFISYSIFLTHQTTAWYFSEMLKKNFHIQGGPLHLLINCTIGLAISIGLAYLFFLAYERPFLSTSQKTAGKVKKVVAPDNCAAP